ncbi:MAG: sigma-70 family RNA polymerase sigma factor [Planctomycetota bacterium]|nr:sigma-70 family RNA polymerase sigma factor [Planctomycetota bacterium]
MKTGKDGAPSVAQLLARMRSGDRDAAAVFVTTYGPMIRRRIRSMVGPQMRRLFDSEDILSTLGRRLDRLVDEGRMNVESEGKLWSFVLRIAEHASIDKARLVQRLRNVEGEEAFIARAILTSTGSDSASDSRSEVDESAVADAFEALEDPRDRQILSLWLAGSRHDQTAKALDMSHAAVRKRWQHITEALRNRLDPDLAA